MKNKYKMQSDIVIAFLKEHQNKILDGTAGSNSVVIDLYTIQNLFDELSLKLISEGLVALA